MSYNDFIAQYPYVDLFLEFFGKIVPVVVAIIAIIVNNAKSSNRDKRNKKIDMIVHYENLLIDKISELENSLDGLLDSFIKILRAQKNKKNINKLEGEFDAYNLSKERVQKCNIELYNLSFCASEILKENVNSKDISDDISGIIKSMENILEKYLLGGELDDASNNQNIVQGIHQIRDDIIEVKSWLSVDIKRIMENTFNLLRELYTNHQYSITNRWLVFFCTEMR